MRSSPAPRIAAALAAALALLVGGCGGDDEDDRANGARQPPAATEEEPPEEREDAPEQEPLPATAEVETVATDLEVPWEIAFLPDGRALITERPGNVLLLGREREGEPRKIDEVEVDQVGEGGLLGIAIDPEFEENDFVYLYRTEGGDNQVVRFRFDGDRLTDQRVLVTGIAAAAIHDGGRIHFGPDGRLWFMTGDAGAAQLAQDPQSLNGKMLRLEPEEYRGDGGEPDVFTLGHRNSQGFDWQPGTGRLYASEHGAVGNDEINLLVEGRNYGWPLVEGPEHGRFAAPLAVYTPSIAPSGATFVTREGSSWTGDFLVAALEGEQIRRLRFDDRREVVVNEPLFSGRFGRLRTVMQGPDGALWALTSNTDGRGNPREDDDRLLRILPPRA